MEDGKIVAIIFFIIILLGLFWFSGRNEVDAKYIAYFYPDFYDNSYLSIESLPLESKEECQLWIDDKIDEYLILGYSEFNMDWECMKDCRLGDVYNQGSNFTCRENVY